MATRWMKFMLFLGIFCILLFVLGAIIKPKEGELKSYMDIWEVWELVSNTDCRSITDDPLKLDISLWAPISEREITWKDMHDLADKGAEYLGISMDSTREDRSIKGVNKVGLRGKDRYGLDYEIIVDTSSGGSKRNRSSRTYLIVNIVGKLDDKAFTFGPSSKENASLVNYQKERNLGEEYPHREGPISNGSKEIIDKIIKKSEKYFEVNGGSPITFISLRGAFTGKLDTNEQQELTKTLAKGIKGNSVETMMDGNILSLSGYSPALDTKPIGNTNFQVALRYNKNLDITYIWLGTPLISIEY